MPVIQDAFAFAKDLQVEILPAARRLVVPLGGFRSIYLDPPWWYDDALRDPLAYPQMKEPELLRFADEKIRAIAAAECQLAMWFTGSYFITAAKMLEIAGFRPIATIPWVKTVVGTPETFAAIEAGATIGEEPRTKIGGGHYWRHEHEEVIFAVRGTPVVPARLRQGTVLYAPHPRHPSGHEKAGEIIHSRKPAKMRELLTVIGPEPRVELFTRESAPGWTGWGNQAPEAA